MEMRILWQHLEYISGEATHYLLSEWREKHKCILQSWRFGAPPHFFYLFIFFSGTHVKQVPGRPEAQEGIKAFIMRLINHWKQYL